ncbi:putative ATP-dependent RNA helicase RhlE [Phaeobacter piscinae]|uniref:DEAD-box ATP-dependent RNA helicase RhpA n=1 Tax=Phaeobacter piscinae TaxID=1580596 RepID=A0AAN1L9V0_9RHOB|nr:DEAD/DEAH box helicase [Phaeobacter piscinae]ATG42932.1 putative ATP-dependent RNA helicase RhlE [Phaeobacter piscinae]AUR35250.1 putative ATP-dependent RNA helicase RhlE [Phaeobacter piscinae]
MTKFSDLNLNPKVLKAIEEAGYESPTPIQAGAIPPALEGRDVLGIAQTGTGKTASFTLPMITLLARGRARARMPRSLVLCPTRELAAQVAENFDTYTKHLKLTKALLIGGVSFKEQDTLIDKGVDVLIATPGRLLDHFERGKLILSDVKVMVVDEADRMLDMGFIPDIERIFGLTPFTRQTLFFSATMAPEIERITNTFLSAPERVEVARQATTSENITQGVVLFKASRRDREGSEKRKLLRHLIDQEGEKCTNAIIFCNRKTDVDIVAKSLKKYGYDAAPIHGDLDQSQRTKTLEGFREGSLRFLVASDVAARGLDVPSVSHVFNFDVPSHAEDYVHRIGRTGRAGRDGTAMMICVPKDEKNLEDIERLVQNEIPRIENPLKKAKAEPKAKDSKDDASGEAPERKTRSRRSSSRSSAAKDVNEAADAQQANDAATAEVDVTAQEQKTPEQEKRASGRGKSAENKSSGQKSGQKGNQKSGRGRGGNDRGNDRNVVGMGDHMPSFIALSFAERRAG